MEEQRRQLIRIVSPAIVTGVVIGVAYGILVYRLEDAIRAAESLQRVTSRSWAPAGLFILVSAAFGWVGAWLAERISGLCGPALWIPLACSMIVAVAVGFGVAALLTTALPDSTWVMFLVSGIGYAAAAGLRMKFAG